MKQIFVLLLCSSLSLSVFGQDCDCSSSFEWVKTIIEENDAGYQYVIDLKGEEAYNYHTKIYSEKVAGLELTDECIRLIDDWFRFFRKGHFSLNILEEENAVEAVSKSDKEIIAQFKDWERVEQNTKAFKKYLDKKERTDLEGIWTYASYRIGLKKVGDEYLGFIIEADGVYWTEGQVKFRIKADGSVHYYMRDHSLEVYEEATLLGNTFLEMSDMIFEREYPVLEADEEVTRFLKVMNSSEPFFEKIDKENALLRIPSFYGSEKVKIDSVILAHKEEILNTPNLIIDIRYNGGGSDISYEEILPILYTNPIRTVGLEFLSTPLNNQRMIFFQETEDYGLSDEDREWARVSYDTLSKYPGEFVSLSEEVSTLELDTVYAYPENVGIIMHEYNGSTAEQFLLAAKQSKKVKLFGTTSYGILDISNMHFIQSPCGNLELGYSLSKSLRIPEMIIDGQGIKPDYYITKDIHTSRWIDFVYDILNQ